MITELKIAELLCTRLCHDLTGPIGAVNNGAEFLSEEGFNLQNQAVDLIVSSAQEAVSRLQFYRMAYGRLNDSGESCLADKKKLVSDFFKGTKVILDWPDNHTDAAGLSISVKMARLILNLIILASLTLMKGGTLAVRLSGTDSGDKQVHIKASGASVKWDKEYSDVLTGKVDIADITPKTVQIYLTHLLAQEIAVHVTHKHGEDSFEITALQKNTDIF